VGAADRQTAAGAWQSPCVASASTSSYQVSVRSLRANRCQIPLIAPCPIDAAVREIDVEVPDLYVAENATRPINAVPAWKGRGPDVISPDRQWQYGSRDKSQGVVSPITS
jgi:hypothetical protein